MTHFEFRFALLCLMNSTDRWQLPFDEIALIRMADPYDSLKARPSQVADCRARLLHADLGFFVRQRFRGDEGLQIAEEFRRDTAATEKVPAKRGPAQIVLPLPDEFSVLPDSRPRIDQKKIKDTESADAALLSKQTRESGVRSGAAKDARFARGSDAADDPLWIHLHSTLGMQEMMQHGALWLKRLNVCRDALATALRDFQSMTPENRARHNPAAYITTAFESERRKSA